jgi:hypothetical protein
MYRNYDGKGSQFGDQSLGVASAVPHLSVYAAERSSDHAVTILLVNESADTRSVTIDLQDGAATRASVFNYVSGESSIAPAADLTITARRATTTIPAYAIQLLVAE